MRSGSSMPVNESNSVHASNKRRPISVTLLSGLVLILAVVYLVRMDQAIVNWNFLKGILEFSPAYLVVTGFFWGISGLVTALLLWLGWLGSRWLTPAYLVAFSLYYWADRLFVSGFPGRNINWPFAAGIDLACIALCFWILNQPNVRNFLEDTDE
jgi:hypothetical protein